MAIAVRAVGAVASGTTAISPGLPTGTVAGDILVMFLETNNEVITVAGWTAATNSPQLDATDATRLSVFWKRAVGGDATTTSDSGNHQVGRIIGFSGCVTSGDPWNITNGAAEALSDTSGSIPGATTTVANCMVVAACCTGTDVASTAFFSAWTNASLASITERIDNVVIAGLGGGIGVATGIKVAAGTYSATTVTYTTASRKGLWSGALAPDTTQFVTANAITVAETLYPATVTARVSVTANLLTNAASLPIATEVVTASSTQSVTANLLTNAPVLHGGVVGTRYQISADALVITPTLPAATNVSISILAAALQVTVVTFPAANITTHNTITANLLTNGTTLYGATSIPPPDATINASVLLVNPQLPTAVSVFHATTPSLQVLFADVLTLTAGTGWTLDQLSVELDEIGLSIDGAHVTFPLAGLSQAEFIPRVGAQLKFKAAPGSVAAEDFPRTMRNRVPQMVDSR